MDRLLPSTICLAIAAGIEHYTADLGYVVLAHPEAFDGVPPEIAKLLTWHAAEEVEHRSVAFDVLQLKSSAYFLRALGFLMASVLLATSTLISFIDFAIQDRDLTLGRLISDFRGGLGKIPMLRSIFRLATQYLRPGFHPSQGGDIRLAQRFLNQLSPMNPMSDFSSHAKT